MEKIKKCTSEHIVVMSLNGRVLLRDIKTEVGVVTQDLHNQNCFVFNICIGIYSCAFIVTLYLYHYPGSLSSLVPWFP